MGEHRDAFGNAPAGLGREQCEAETLGHIQRYFLTAEVQGNTGERDCQRERQLSALKRCTPRDNESATRLKVNSTELRWKNEWMNEFHTLKLNWAKFSRSPILAV